MTNSMVRPRRSFKAPLKAKLASEKGHSHCLAVCCPSDPLEISESWWHHYIWEVCSASQWDALKTARPAAGQQKGPSSSCSMTSPTAHSTTNASQVGQIWLESFASSAIFTWTLTNYHSLLQASRQLFCRENASTTSTRQKMLAKNSRNPEAQVFILQE